jgi:hypothetical protein
MPLTPFTGVTVNPIPLQTVVTIFVTPGVGLTVTVRVNVVPVHPLIVGVMKYCTFTAAFVVLISVSLMFAVAPAPAPLEIPATTGRVQANVQPGVALVAV